MINYNDEIITTIYNALVTSYPSIVVKGEYVEIPSAFPCVTIEETNNNMAYLDNGEQKYANIQYRVNVFSTADNRRKETRNIMSVVDTTLYALNFRRTSMSPMPNIYNSSVYELQATYEATIDKNGVIFRR